MASRDPRIDAYIAKAAPFARPVLRHVRQLVHQGCPEVEETIKWSMPHFEYHGIMLGMAAFKEHCSIGFWKGELIMGKSAGSDGGMGHFGRLTSLKHLPSDRQFIEYVHKATELNRQGIKKPADLKPKSARRGLTIPEYFRTALHRNKKAAATFNGFSYTNKKEYLEWITEAKPRRNSLETVTDRHRVDGPRETAKLEIPELRLIVSWLSNLAAGANKRKIGQ